MATPDSDLLDKFLLRFCQEANDAVLPFVRPLLEESDRGAALVAQSALDGLLFQVFETLFTGSADSITPSELKWLLRGSLAPLGGFFRRVQMAHALGLIDRDLKKILEDINDIRVNPAHSECLFAFDRAVLDRVIAKIDKRAGNNATARLRRLDGAAEAIRATWNHTQATSRSMDDRFAFMACFATVYFELYLVLRHLSVFGYTSKCAEDAQPRFESYVTQRTDSGLAPQHE